MYRLYLFLLSLCACAAGMAQQPQTATQKPSSLLQPAIDSVARAGSAVDLNRWKGSNAMREEVDGYLASMQKDIENTLPPLLAAADAAPDSASASLPVLLNVDALYSVLLRVTMVAHTSAPRDQSTALDQSATLLDNARRDLGDALLAAARTQERHTAALQAQVQQQADAAAAQQAVPAAGSAKKTKIGKSRPSPSKTQ